MKLIYCPECATLINIDRNKTYCRCQASWGMYDPDGYQAMYGGKAIPVGVLSKSFINAVKEQPENGSGVLFTAFVIPKICNSFIKYEYAE